MKKLFLRLSLFLCGICVGQPTPPKFETPNKFIGVEFNYGFEKTLDFHLIKSVKNNIVGLGYSTYIGNDVKGYSIGQSYYSYLNSYTTKDNAYYLLLGRQIKRLSICAKVGVYTQADYNNYLEVGGNPNNVYYSKVNGDMRFQYGGDIHWLLNKSTGIGVGYDKFNGFTIGVKALL